MYAEPGSIVTPDGTELVEVMLTREVGSCPTQGRNLSRLSDFGQSTPATRADIAAVTVWARDSFTTVDGAPWIHGTSAGPMAIQDASGQWWQIDASLPCYVTWFGTVSSGAAIAAAASALGYVRFPPGSHRISADVTIAVPVYFEPGAYVSIDTTKTLTFSSRVESPRQWIFRGAGSVGFTGDDSREIHISWFGAVTENYGADMAAYFNAAYAAMGNSRESILLLDGTLYTLKSAVTATRGAFTKGIGTRRTVFDLSQFVGTDVITTSGEGCRFEGLQFENNGGPIISGAVISTAYQYTLFEDIGIQNATVGLRLAGKGCRAHHIQDINTAGTAAAGSCLISIENVDCSVDDVYHVGSTGPESVVKVGSSGSAVSNFSVTNVEFSSPSIGVLVRSAGQYIARGHIQDVRAHGSGAAAVQIENTVSNNIQDVVIQAISASSAMTAGVVVNVSAGGVSGLTMNNITTLGLTGNGISLTQSGGTLSDVRIGLTRLDATTPIATSGTITGLSVNYQSYSMGGLPAMCWDAGVIGDDGVYTLNLGQQIYNGTFIVNAGATNYVICAVRAATTPAITSIVASALVDVRTGALTGTTGTDGHVTVSVDAAGLFYVENRLGAGQAVEVALLTGLAFR